MNNFEKQTITIHISYIDEMTLYAMEDSLRLLNEALNVFSKEFEIVMSETYWYNNLLRYRSCFGC